MLRVIGDADSRMLSFRAHPGMFSMVFDIIGIHMHLQNMVMLNLSGTVSESVFNLSGYFCQAEKGSGITLCFLM
jgi:hypothetical protein